MSNKKIRNYTVTDEILGTGGMGVVYRGVREFSGLDTREAVACKVIRAVLAPDDDYQRLFLREAFTAMALAHPYLVKVHDCIRHDGTIYLFMELIDGVSLETLVRHHGPLAENLVANVIHRVAQALAYLHGQGICHRDISPPNILISKQGQIKVSDFGLARPSPKDKHDGRPEHGGHSSPIRFKGRLPFACPACLQAQRQTSSSDVWALLVTAYYAVSGYLPFGPNTGDSLDPCQRLERIVMQDLALPEQPFSAAFFDLVRDLYVMDSTSRRFQNSQAVAEYLADNFDLQTELPELGTLVRSVADRDESQVVNLKKPQRSCQIPVTESAPEVRFIDRRVSCNGSAELDGRSRKRYIVYLAVLVLFCFAIGGRPGLGLMADETQTKFDDPICPIASPTRYTLESAAMSYLEPELDEEAEQHKGLEEKTQPKKRAANTLQRKKRRKNKAKQSGIFVVSGKSY